MKRIAFGSAIVFATLQAGSGAGHAITLPDNGSCDAPGADGCFKITNTTTGVGLAVSGANSGSGPAVSGKATGTSVGARGVQGETQNGFGVYGLATGTGYGVYALSENSFALYARTNGIGTGNSAIYGYTEAFGSKAIVGHQAGNDSETAVMGIITDRAGNPVSNGFAVRGVDGGISVLGENSVGGTGVMGDSRLGLGVLGASIDFVGVRGTSTNGIAIEGISNNGDGVHAVTHNATGRGVYAQNLAPGGGGYGLYAVASGTGQAVHGENPSDAGWAGYFNGKVHTTATYSSSDARLKKDVHDLAYGVARVLKVRPITFKWKKGGEQVQVGVVAQELQKVVPEVVQADADSGMLSVNYPALVPLVIKAVQEQQKIIETLETRIAALERGRSPASSVLGGSVGIGLALGLLPIGFVVVRGKRREKSCPGAALDRK